MPVEDAEADTNIPKFKIPCQSIKAQVHCSISFPNKFIFDGFFDTAFGTVVFNKGCRRQGSLCAIKPAYEPSAEFKEM